jgi:ATP-dependent Clp protease ATP-binding subunit ClpX
MFDLDNITLEFDNASMLSIASKAKELETNARGLKNIIEKVLLPYQFDAINLADRGLRKILISKDTITGNMPAMMIFDNTANEQT